MNKTFWGPSVWCSIHIASASYKPENKYSFTNFIYSLPYLLPCKDCCKHLYKNLQTLPLTEKSLDNNKNLFMWSYLLHDLVNKQLNKKPSPVYSFAEKYYFQNINDSTLWGPCFWKMIHSFAASYKHCPENKLAFKQFIYSLTGILPCNISKDNYLLFLKQLPLTDDYFKDANNLFLWTFLLHDLVNKKLNKISPPFQDIKSIYFNQNICKSCSK
jgi:hypothetical protein